MARPALGPGPGPGPGGSATLPNNNASASRQQHSTATTTTSTGTANAPPSPTLTNPDMILPFEGERESSTPSPPFDAVRRLHEDIHHTQLQPVSPEYRLHESRRGYDRAESHDVPAKDTRNDHVGVALAMGHEKQISESSPQGGSVWYEHHDVAPPLSDIGEEDEEEDEDFRQLKTARVSQDTVRGPDGSPPQSPSIGPQRQWLAGDGREVYSTDDSGSASSSTVSASGGMSNSYTQEMEKGDSSRNHTPCSETDSKEGDGRETASEYDEGYAERRSLDSEENRMSSIVEEAADGSDDDIKEAERILANAKKRLTHMEGNLSRARSSTRLTPSPAASSGFSPTQPFFGLSKSLPKGERRPQTSLAGALLRQRAWQERNAHQSSHTRGISDINDSSLNGARHTSDPRRPPIRSVSALATTDTSGLEGPASSPRAGYFGSRYDSDKASRMFYNYAPPSPARERRVRQPNSPSSPYKPQPGSGSSTHAPPKPKLESMEDFNAAYPSSPPSRTHSQLQVRDLQGQMLDLKSKISTLQQRARQDGLRRRSLQSLRTPSPFTAAEQWYASALDYGDAGLRRGSLVVTTAPDTPHEDKETADDGGDAETYPFFAVRGKDNEQLDTTSMAENRRLSMAETEDHFEDAVDFEEWPSDTEIDRDALEEILNEPLDSPDPLDEDLLQEFPSVPPIPDALRHEDRLDAFDYEHFYLHSVLGNYSGGAPRRDSWSSDGSAETARAESRDGPDSPTIAESDTQHRRKNSGDSISTAATFATATENEYPSEAEDYADDDIDEAILWNRESSTPTPTGKTVEPLETGQLEGQHPAGTNQAFNVDSPTCPGLTPGSTPRASHRRHYSKDRDPFQSSASASTSSPLSSSTSDPISFLMSLPTQSALRQQIFTSSPLTAEDTALLEPLLQNLGQVCSDLLSASSMAENKGVHLRRRLNTANKVLKGELDV